MGHNSAAPVPRWSEWAPLGLEHRFTATSFAETLDGGQAFRWRWQPEPAAWQGVFGEHVVQLRLAVDAGLHFRAATPVPLAQVALHHYLAMAPQLEAALARLPASSDPALAASLAACPGLILLRQPFAETLLGFILSSTKRIPQIRQLCDTLASRFGPELAPGIHGLPSWAALATVGELELRRCALGFRARYVHETAGFLATHPGWLERVEALPYPEAKAELTTLPGVGEKVADCVLLFGAGRLEAFPVDVWILKTLAARYGLAGWGPAQLAQFGRVHFGPLAGLAQQYLFASARADARK
ncbi:MAG: DNA-binding protein [Opitutaceae bacterium]|nr:DNA-binding protein [Opitutaceae bacterium]